MGCKSPLVSVIIPAYNAEAFLGEAIESIERQTYEPLEIIVVDDGSTDGTARVATGFGKRIHYLLQTNRGAAAARNSGLRLASGELIAFLDADDLWAEGALKSELEILGEVQEVDAVLGLVQYFRTSIDPSDHRSIEKIAEPTLSFNLGAALFRQRVFKHVGLFDETLSQSEDLDWFMRLREHAKAIQVLDRVTLLYRIHTQNIIRDKSVREKFMMRALKQSLDRRRGKGEAASSLPRLMNPRLSKDNPGEEGKNG